MRTIGTCKDCRFWNKVDSDDSNSNEECHHKAFGIDYYKDHQSVELGAYDDSYPITTPPNFGCIHWTPKPGFNPDWQEQAVRRSEFHQPNPNYPSKTKEQLRIEDLERENDAALEKIVALSNALCELGFDPTQITKSPEHPESSRPCSGSQ